MIYKFINKYGEIEEYTDAQLKVKFKTSWWKLHQDFKGYFSKEYKEFLDKFNLPYTHFNLNCLNDTGMVCLNDTGMVCLTESQIKNLKRA